MCPYLFGAAANSAKYSHFEFDLALFALTNTKGGVEENSR
jgi:hypothetical protein